MVAARSCRDHRLFGAVRARFWAWSRKTATLSWWHAFARVIPIGRLLLTSESSAWSRLSAVARWVVAQRRSSGTRKKS